MAGRALCLTRDHAHYRRDCMLAGLIEAGFEIANSIERPEPGDVLVIWNRYQQFAATARQFESAGAKVVVVENGWIGEDQFALCVGQHNGAGLWNCGQDDRWSMLDIAVQPWRRDGNHILVLPQRGFGPPGVAMPLDWPKKIGARLAAVTGRPVIIRQHPGKRPHPPLEPDFECCWAAVTWGSGAAIKAIVAGIPVFHDMPAWIGASAARRGIDNIEDPYLGDRYPMLRRLAWAQWSADEIASGEAFKCLLT